jgi:probable F420-dependent oxidoreductase
MRIGLFVPFISPVATPDYIQTVGRAAEERGFESLWVAEHVVLFDDYSSVYPYAEDGRIPAGGESGILEPFTSLAFLAAVTERIRLGTGVCLVPQRNPVYTAKEATVVDWLSGGRLDLGIGVGWLAEEFRALEVPFEHRGSRCRSYIEVMRTLWCDPVSEYKDEFYELPACRQYPKPVQSPHPPLHFGGESDAALRRVADLGQGWYGFNLNLDEFVSRLARLDELLAERGRSRSDLQISLGPKDQSVDEQSLVRFHEAGADQLVVGALGRDADAVLRRLDGLVRTLVEPARAL